MKTFAGRGGKETLLTLTLIWMVASGVTPAALAQTGPGPFVVTSLADNGPGSLRQAILDANLRPGPDIVDFAPGLHGKILLTSGALKITDSLTIQGPGAFWLTVSGNGISRVFEIEGASNIVTITGLTVAQGVAQGTNPGMGGGILLANSSLTLSRVLLVDNRAVGALSTAGSSSTGPNGRGGGIFNMSGNLHIVGSALINNQAVGGSGAAGGPTGGAGLGGGIANESGTLTLADTALIGNKATGGDGGEGMGGGIVNNGPLTVTNTAFIGNQTVGGSGGSASGGGIGFQAVVGPVQATIQTSTFAGNQAIGGSGGSGGNGGAAEGGGLFVGANNELTITSAIINNNLAKGGNGSNGGNGGKGLGGGIFDNPGATLVLNADLITGNSAVGGAGGAGGNGMGGGLYNLGTFVVGPTTVISGNFASTSFPNVYPPIVGQ